MNMEVCVLTATSLRNPLPPSNNPLSTANFFPLLLDWTGRDNLGLERAVRPGVLVIHVDRADMFNIHRSSAVGLDMLHYTSARGKVSQIWALCMLDLEQKMNAVATCWAELDHLISSSSASMNVVLLA